MMKTEAWRNEANRRGLAAASRILTWVLAKMAERVAEWTVTDGR